MKRSNGLVTSLVSGLSYVLRWSTRAWRVAHQVA